MRISVFAVLVLLCTLASANDRFGISKDNKKQTSKMVAVLNENTYSVEIENGAVVLTSNSHAISVRLSENIGDVELAAWSLDSTAEYFFLNSLAIPDPQNTHFSESHPADFTLFVGGSECRHNLTSDPEIQCTLGAAAQLAAAGLAVAAACGGPQAAATLPCAAALVNYVAASIAWNAACQQY